MVAKVKIKRSYAKNWFPSFNEWDLFWRKWFWESLINLIDNSDNESLVISINAPWWEWKTYFLQQWKILLEENSKKVIFFDSFKSDYIDDPFTALLGEVMKTFQDEQTTYESIKQKWVNVAKSLLPLAWKVWARFVLWWDISSVDDKIEEIIEWDIAEWIHNSLKEYIKQGSTIDGFKKALEEGIKKHWKIIFIIDELDRCRPDFALRLLERIKHFFDIPWLYFVLGINKNQLLSYINKIYGNIDCSNYLQKFIDVETILPVKNNAHEKNVEKYLKHLINENRDIFLEKDVWEQHHILAVFKLIVKYGNFSLRDIEKAFNYLVICQKSLSVDNQYIAWELIAVLVWLKVIDINYLKSISNWENLKDEIIQIFKISKWKNTSYEKFLISELWFLFGEELTEEIRRVLWNRLYYWDYDHWDRFDILLRHIEFIDMFNI